MKFRLSRHAKTELARRGIPRTVIENILDNPEQVVDAIGGRKAFQSRVDFGDGKVYLVRAIVDGSVDPAVVITIYRTSKIAKYWRPS